MDAFTAGESPSVPHGGTLRADTDIAQRTGTVALTAFIDAPSQRALRASLLILLTLAAGWTDALCYLTVGRVFASFMTGNILFVGLSIAQGDTALLLRASLAFGLFLLSITFGSRYLQSLPAQQSVERWRGTLARYLLVEGLILLVFALVWAFGGNLAQQPVEQIVLVGIAAFGMGLQGALVAAFGILDVVSVALTGTELLLGIRLAQWAGKQPIGPSGATSVPFLLALILSYTLAALVVALAVTWVGIAFIPCLLVAVAVAAITTTPVRRKVSDSVARRVAAGA